MLTLESKDADYLDRATETLSKRLPRDVIVRIE